MTARHGAFLIGVLSALSLACSTHLVPLAYSPSSASTSGFETLTRARVGRFDDARGTEPNWLGAIRGGYGNPLKKLYTDRATAEVVADSLRDALRSRGLLEEGAATAFEIQGTIEKLDCSYYFNREAHAHLTIRVIQLQPEPHAIYSNSYREDRTERGAGAGIFGNVEHLRAFAEATLNGAIDRIFADPGFLEALRRADATPSTSE